MKCMSSFIVYLLILIVSCKSQTIQKQQCIDSYKNAKVELGNYAKSKSNLFLARALTCLDTAMQCNDIKQKSVDLKITIYNLLKDYQNGQKFIDSLSITDFDKPFKKRFYSSLFKAQYLQSIGDSAGGKVIYLENIEDLKLSLIESNTKKLNEEVCASLIFIESKIYSNDFLLSEIENLKSKFPEKTNFLDELSLTYIQR